MKALASKGVYEISENMRNNLKDFTGGWASGEKMRRALRDLYEESGYVIDTHTAVAASVYKDYIAETKDRTKTVIVSTASPYKFSNSVLAAIGVSDIPEDDYEQAKLLKDISGTEIPKAVAELQTAPVVHNTVCDVDKMQSIVEEILKII